VRGAARKGRPYRDSWCPHSVEFRAPIDVPSRQGDYDLELLVVQLVDVNKGRFTNVRRRFPVEIE
jgi:hypothetical protein